MIRPFLFRLCFFPRLEGIVHTPKNQYNTDMSYPIHFRKKILAKLEEGQSIRAVAQHFEINKNTIVEWKKRIEIKRTRPRKPSKVDYDALRADVEQYPDDYQYERAARFGCSTSTIGDALKRLNITVKKRPYGTHPKAKTELREQYLKDLNRLRYQHPIIYLDESGFKSHEHRPHGYSKQGIPCYGTYNWQLKNQTNAIGAIHEGKLFAVGLFDSKVNSDVFHFWVDKFLLPELPSNSIIVMDNAAFHKRPDIQDLLTQHGHQILWLPPYSPDLNPIEKMWAWVKAKRKKWLVNSIDKLFSRFFNECMGN